MYNRSFGLDRFKKAQTTEPFHVDEIRARAGQNATPSSHIDQSRASQGSSLAIPGTSPSGQVLPTALQRANALSSHTPPALASSQGRRGGAAVTSPTAALPAAPGEGPSTANAHTTTVGEGGSTWQAPDWAVEPKTGVYHLEVSKDGQVVDMIPLDRKRTVFGRQHATCHFVLEHPSLSRQHAAVVHHRNGSVFVIDLGSVHGTFVSNERLTKDIPMEIEPDQSLRFAASSRSYVLRKSAPPPPPPTQSSGATLAEERPTADAQLPAPPDPSDAEAVLEYNTLMNRLGLPVMPSAVGSDPSGSIRKRKRREGEGDGGLSSEASQRNKVRFRDDHGGILVEVVGFSDGEGVSNEPGPVGVQEGGSLVGKFDSLVQTVLIPRVKSKNTAVGLAEEGQPPADTQTESRSEGEQGDKAVSSPGGLGGSRGGGDGMSDKLKSYLGKALAKSQGLYGGIGDESPAEKSWAWGKTEEEFKRINDGNIAEDVSGDRTQNDEVGSLYDEHK